MRTLYFDHAATTPVSREVLEEMLPYFEIHLTVNLKDKSLEDFKKTCKIIDSKAIVINLKETQQVMTSKTVQCSSKEIYQEASARLTFQNLCFLKQLCLKDSLHLSLSHYNRTHHKASWQSR